MELFGEPLGTVCKAADRPPCLLFLDFDGVVHPLVSAETFLPRCVDCVNDIAAALDARIVLSTAWRGPDWHRYNALFKDRVIGHTPELFDLSVSHLRFHEIHSFLEATGWESVLWVALDDAKVQADPEQAFLPFRSILAAIVRVVLVFAVRPIVVASRNRLRLVITPHVRAFACRHILEVGAAGQ